MKALELGGDEYYKHLDGAKYDRELLEEAQRAQEGAGDGRISEADMKRIIDVRVKDAGVVTEIELATLDYIEKEGNLTKPAQAVLKDFVAKHNGAGEGVSAIDIQVSQAKAK